MKPGPKPGVKAQKKMKEFMDKRETEKNEEKETRKENLEFAKEQFLTASSKEQSSFILDPDIRKKVYEEEKRKEREIKKLRKQLNTVSWKPSSFLNIPEKYKRSDRRYRWCSKNREGNINKKLQEGWTIDKEIIPKMVKDGAINVPTHKDGMPVDNTFQVRELVLMWMPINLAEARNAYYRERANVNHKREVLERELAEAGSRSYGKIIEENLNKEEQHG